jgi:AMP phosphorylase
LYVDISSDLVNEGEFGLFIDIFEKYDIKEGKLARLSFAKRAPSLKAIYKKLYGGVLNFNEIYQIIKDIVDRRLNNLEVTFFIAPSFNENNLDLNEMYYTTKSIAMLGDTFDFGEIVADKHSTGGLPGNRVTPIIIPIVSSFGVCIPKTSSRSITSPAGTSDAVESIMKVDFTADQIKEIVKENNACLVWGGALKLAPADDIIINITRSLGIEPYSKMIISVMAKKVAMGIRYLIIDIPVAKGAKISDMKQAKNIEKLFMFLAKKFNIKTKVAISKSFGPIGRGIGPALEMRDVLRVLQQKESRPLDLENKAVKLAGQLLEMTNVAKRGRGEEMARVNLKNGLAFQKMTNIMKSQNGNENIDSEDIKIGEYFYEFKATNNGIVKSINNANIVELCSLLGTPKLKGSGVYLNKNVSEKYQKGDTLFTLYSESEQRLNLAKEALEKLKDVYR